jgi:hypothetical protein
MNPYDASATKLKIVNLFVLMAPSMVWISCWKMLLRLPRVPVCWVCRELCQDPQSDS